MLSLSPGLHPAVRDPLEHQSDLPSISMSSPSRSQHLPQFSKSQPSPFLVFSDPRQASEAWFAGKAGTTCRWFSPYFRWVCPYSTPAQANPDSLNLALFLRTTLRTSGHPTSVIYFPLSPSVTHWHESARGLITEQ